MKKRSTGSGRKKLLDLNQINPHAELSVRPTWADKYKKLLASDPPFQSNGDTQPSSTSGPIIIKHNSVSSVQSSNMESKVENFLKEIDGMDNEPAASVSMDATSSTQWVKCVDQNTGHPYYWHPVTNEVSWQPPIDTFYGNAPSTSKSLPTSQTKKSVVMKKKTEVVRKRYPWENDSGSDDEKIELISSFGPKSDEDESDVEQPPVQAKPKGILVKAKSKRTPLINTPLGPELPSSSEMLPKYSSKSSFNGNAPGNAEKSTPAPGRSTETGDSSLEKVASDADEVSADNLIALIEQETPPDYAPKGSLLMKTKPVSSFALIANYGDDSDVEDSPEKPTPPVVKPNRPLFPILENLSNEAVASTSAASILKEKEIRDSWTLAAESSDALSCLIDSNAPDSTSKAFKRKRRIELGNIPKPTSFNDLSEQVNADEGKHIGLGFKSAPADANDDSEDGREKRVVPPGGIQFVKAETINVSEETKQIPQKPLQSKEDEVLDVEDTAHLIKDKLKFLIGDQLETSPVLFMYIALESLYDAWSAGALDKCYMSRWLTEKAQELAHNESHAAPEGWICQWDRERKRYSYKNSATGEIVFDYPEVVEDAGDQPTKTQSVQRDEQKEVEMELSETPPPISSPADQPRRSITPPPPPVTPPPPPPPPPLEEVSSSSCNEEEITEKRIGVGLIETEPLPPGVDACELLDNNLRSSTKTRHKQFLISSTSSKEVDLKHQKRLNSELDSFYSMIASLKGDDSTNSNASETDSVATSTSSVIGSTQNAKVAVSSTSSSSYSHRMSNVISDQALESRASNLPENSKKRKKTKLASGLSLKKKGVSSLVAKWQQVREEALKSYTDSDSDNDVSSSMK